MGKILWTLLAAGMGFMAAVAATPDDEVRRAYEHGYAEGAKSLQTDAVRRGYGAWEPAEEAGSPSAFRWAGQLSRGRNSREPSDHRPTEDRERSAHRPKKHGGSSDQGVG
jgi:hypothetical protein